MIRLLALREVMKNVTAEQATQLCCGNSQYIALCKALPWVFPRTDWRELIQAQLLSGIKPRYINARLETTYTNVQMSRIRKHPTRPEAEFIKKPDAYMEDYITLGRQFYYNVLRPLQFQAYPDGLTPYALWWLIRTKVRNSTLPLMYIHDETITEMFKIMQSQPASSKGNFLKEMGTSAEVCRMVNTTQSNVKNFNIIPDDAGNISQKYIQQLEEVFALMYNVRTIGIINDDLMEAKYESFF